MKALPPVVVGSLLALLPVAALADDASDAAGAPPVQMPATTVTAESSSQNLGGMSASPFPPGSNALFQKASDLTMGRDFKGAIAVLNTVIARFPQFPDGYQRRGYAEYCAGDLDDSIRDMDKAIELRPNFGVAFLTRGTCELVQEDYGKAVDDLSMAVTIFQGMGMIRVLRARAEAAIGESEQAAADLDRAIQGGGAAASYAGRASFRYQSNYFAGSLADYQTAAARAQPVGRYARGAANLLAKTGDFDGALVTFGRCVALDPKNPDLYLERGNLQLKHQLFDEAKADFSAAIALRPRDRRAHFLLAQALQAAGDGPGAIAEYGAALALSPQNALILERRGLARLGAKDQGGAEGDFKQASAVAPHFANVWVDLAALEDRRGNLPGAVDYLSKAIEAAAAPAIPPSIPSDHQKMLPTDVYSQLSETYPDFVGETLAPPKPAPAWLYLLRATEEGRLNRLTEALIDARASVSLEPGDANQKLLARLQALKAP
jgi:tetratricopeptide (TPR) repeat protein